MDFKGVIIQESLHDTSILDSLKIVDTKVEDVTDKHETPWLEKWTLHTVTVPMCEAEKIAERLAKALDTEHSGNWYADFKNDQFHYVIFTEKVFKLDRNKKAEWESMRVYALSVGLPEHQVLTFEGVDEMEKERRD